MAGAPIGPCAPAPVISRDADGADAPGIPSGARLRESLRLVLIGVAGSIVVLLTTFQMTDASLGPAGYLPVGHDSFYHASRILDSVAGGGVAQFDPRMHAPQGDWVTWPWGYDASIATVVRAVHGTLRVDPMTAAAHVPPLLGVLGVWLVLGATALLGLRPSLAAIGVAAYALHAFTQYQFGVGSLDHHGAEQIFVLAALVSGVWWLKQPAAALRAAALGAVLGLALGVHASLVLLQLPVLSTLALHWVRRDPLPMPAAAAFAAGLNAAALLVLLPAETFWQGRFELYYLSGLQLYVCGVSSLLLLAFARWPFTRPALATLVAAVTILAVPLAAAVRFSTSFMAGDLPGIADIDEIASPYSMIGSAGGIATVSRMYSLLVWFAPLLCIGGLVLALRERLRWLTYLWLWTSLGLALLMLQFRFGGLGVAFLYLPLLVLLQRAAGVADWPQPRTDAIALAVFVAAYAPTIFWQLWSDREPAMDRSYATLRPVLPALAAECARKPGIVLATPSDGHIVRFLTDCAVISNNFRLTAADLGKIGESLRLIGLPAASLHAEAPYVTYVLARLIPPAEAPDPVLFDELLNPRDGLPAGFQPIVQAGVTLTDGRRLNILGVFAVVNQSPASSPGT